MGLTASFLPKPVVGVNGSGMHTNVSISKGGKNLFWDPKGEEKLSKLGWSFLDRILTHGNISVPVESECERLPGGWIRTSKRRTRSRLRRWIAVL